MDFSQDLSQGQAPSSEQDPLLQILKQLVQGQGNAAPPPDMPANALASLLSGLQQREARGVQGMNTSASGEGPIPNQPLDYNLVGGTAGYMGAKRRSDLPPAGGMPDLGRLRPIAEVAQRSIKIPGVPDTGTLLDLLPVIQKLTPEVQAAIVKAQAPGLFSGSGLPSITGTGPQIGGAPDAKSIEQLGAFNTWAEKNKVPSKIRAQMSDRLFPWAKEDKLLTPEQGGKMFKYDPSTLGWAPLQPADYDKPVSQLMKEGYRVTTQQQQDASKSLPAMVQAFANLEDAYGKISKQGFLKRAAGEVPGVGSYINPEAADYLKSAQQFTTFFDAEVMGKRGAGSPQMQQIRARVLPQLTTNPEIGTKLLGDFKTLMGVIKDNQVKMYSGQEPDLKREEAVAAKINAKAGGVGQPGGGAPIRAQSKSGKPIVSKDGGKTWEYE